MSLNSVLFADPLPHMTLDQELEQLGRQIAVGTVLRKNPEILAYFTLLGESHLNSHTDLGSIMKSDPDMLKSTLISHAAEIGTVKHMHDLITGVEARTDQYNLVAIKRREQEEAQ